MKSLEERYRQLLAWYPRGHREKYEEEMLAVLLAGARSGQRRPGVAETLDLVASGVRARICGATFGLSDRRWRAAAGVVGVVLPIALALKNLRPMILSWAWELRVPWIYLGPSAETIVLTIAWTLTAVVAVVGLRRSAATLAWATVATNIGFLAPSYGDDPMFVLHDVRTVAIGLAAAICLTVAGPLHRRFLLTRPGRAFGSAALLALAWFAAYPAFGRTVEIGDGMRIVEPWIRTPLYQYSYLGLHDAISALFAAASILAALIGLWRLERGVRRRCLATIAPFAALVWAIDVYYPEFAASSGSFHPSILLVAGQWLGLLCVPLLTFAVGVLVVHRRERTIELIALGRAAQRR